MNYHWSWIKLYSDFIQWTIIKNDLVTNYHRLLRGRKGGNIFVVAIDFVVTTKFTNKLSSLWYHSILKTLFWISFIQDKFLCIRIRHIRGILNLVGFHENLIFFIGVRVLRFMNNWNNRSLIRTKRSQITNSMMEISTGVPIN